MDLAHLLMSVRPPATAGPARYMASAADGRVIRASLDGDGNATEELVRRYWDEAHRTAFLVTGDKWLAEDAAQEALVAAIASLKTFDIDRGFGPWLHRIAVNKAIDRARQSRRGPDPHAGIETSTEVAEPGQDYRSTHVLEALATLEPEDRAILVLKHVLNFRATEIGEWLDMPASTVRVRLHRAGIRIRELVKKEAA